MADRKLTLADAAGAEHRTLADRAFWSLHRAIVGGVLEPGERLRIEDVAEQLDMSAMPIREALRRLESVGLVRSLPHRGARVAELSLDDLREVYEARLALEPLAIGHAAERRTDEDLASARRALDQMMRAAKRRGRERWTAHTEYHFTLYRAAKSRWLLRLITPLWESSERYRISAGPRWNLDLRESEHEELLRAVAEQMPERAAGLLHNHLAVTANHLAEYMGAGGMFEIIEVDAGAAASAGAD